MSSVGDIISGKSIGRVSRRYYLRVSCPTCLQERWITRKYNKDLISRECRSCSLHNLHNKLRGEEHPRWRGGRLFNQNYWRVWVDPSDEYYTMADKYGYVLEHRYFMAKHLGRCLESWEIVHHKGIKYALGSAENKQDNRIENLELKPSSVDHLSTTLIQKEMLKLQREILKWQKLAVWLLQNHELIETKPKSN